MNLVSLFDRGKDEPEEACGVHSNCINRALNIECLADTCPTGPFCQNQRFQLKQYASVEVFDTKTKGFGLKAKSFLKKYKC